jgi:transposase
VTVIIGIDPHKSSHTAVAIDEEEDELARVRVRATRRQLHQLIEWAEPFEKRTWAIEPAGGLGYLLSQQLVAAGEEVLDVPPTLASRIRVLASGRSSKNDPNDARSVAIAALRSSLPRSLATPVMCAGSPTEISSPPTTAPHRSSIPLVEESCTGSLVVAAAS